MAVRDIGALTAMTMGFAVVQLDVSVVNVGVRPIGHDLGGSLSSLQWVVNAYTIAFASLILGAGALSDRYGAKRLFLVGFTIFVIGSCGCALSPDLGALVASRAVQGVGAAVLVPSSLALVNHSRNDSSERSRAVGVWAAGGSVALSAGPIIGGVLIDWVGWRSIFLINVPIGILAVVLTFAFVHETPPTDKGLDISGQVLAVLCLASLSAGIIEAEADGLGLWTALVGGGVAVASGVGFVVHERRSRSPMLPLSLFRSRSFSAATIVGFLVNVSFYGLIFVFSLYFQETQRLSPLNTGLVFAPMTVGVLVSNLTANRISGRWGNRLTVTAGGVLMVIGLATLAFVIERDSAIPVLLLPLVAVGLGLGAVVPAITAAQLGSVEKDESGTASGTLNTARQAGSVIGVAVLGSIAGGSDLVAGLRVDLIIGIALTIALGVAATALPGRVTRR